MTKGQVFLIHGDQFEAEVDARQIRVWGWQVPMEAKNDAEAAKAIKAGPPDAIVIFLSRLPSQRCHASAHLAELKATQGIPVILVSGEGDALEKTSQALPNDVYIDEDPLAVMLEQFMSTYG